MKKIINIIRMAVVIAFILISGCTEKNTIVQDENYKTIFQDEDHNRIVQDADYQTIIQESDSYINVSGILIGVSDREGSSCTLKFKGKNFFPTTNGCDYPYFLDDNKVHNYSIEKKTSENITYYKVQNASIPSLNDVYSDPASGLWTKNSGNNLTVIGNLTAMISFYNGFDLGIDKHGPCILSFEGGLNIPTDNGCKHPYSRDRIHTYAIQKISIGYNNSTSEILRVMNVTIKRL